MPPDAGPRPSRASVPKKAGTGLLDRLINQLDTLIPFLAISHEDVFRLIQGEGAIWGSPNQRARLPETYNVYRIQVVHAAFLLGYSYFEAFLADLARAIYELHPGMLPQNKQLAFEDILAAGDYKTVVERMVDKEVYAIFDPGMENALTYFGTRFQLRLSNRDRDTVIQASYLRNCIIHNLARADRRLASVSRYTVGEHIELESSDVHSLGITARKLARELFAEAIRKHLRRKPKMPRRSQDK